MSKLIERLVFQQLKDYFNDHGLLPVVQSAYRQNHSTETAILKITSDVFKAAGICRVTLLAMLDLSAVFDTWITLLSFRGWNDLIIVLVVQF